MWYYYFMENISLLKSYAHEIGIKIDEKQAQQFALFYDAVVASNKLFNLTAIVEEKEFIVKHIIDSVAGISEIPNGAYVCDIGAGAGFPSMPIAIMRHDVNVLAIDSTAKKMNFLANCAKEMDINNLKTKAGRAEEMTALFEKFDVVVARAVSSLQILLELAMPLLKVGGKFVAYKTDESELELSKNAQKTLYARHIETKSFSLPNGDRRAIITFEKLQKTPQQYPRQYGTIKKKPL